jgi:carboxyl-terminal processing protease
MKKTLGFLFALIFFVTAVTAQTTEDLIEKNSNIDTNKVIMPWSKHPQVAQTIARLLVRYHYRRQPLNDSLSSEIFDTYLKRLDNGKMYFTKHDIDNFEEYRYELDDDMYDGNLIAPYRIFNIFKRRLTERIPKIDAQLEKGFDFTKDEYYYPDRSDSAWLSDEKAIDELWRKRLKYEALNLKLAGKKWDKIKETLKKRYHRFHKLILQYDAEDVFSLFINSVTYNIDPHTSYFSPKQEEDFKINMSLALEGIGATLTVRDDYTTIVKIIPGGPAARSGKLKIDDKIVAVAQGEDGEWVDVIGWRIDDVVQLIRGKKGTIVRLQIIHPEAAPDDPPEEITLVRDKIKLEDQAAKKEIIEIERDGVKHKLGVIIVPEFYTNFGRGNSDKNFASTSLDVRKLIDTLKTENVEGIIIDLRNDGGGSLTEAIELTGLFIKEGPVVQVKDVTGKVDVESDPDPAIVYDGPLAVMVNPYSASASEIFSGAIQDYGRGLILGSQTFGKGTVQNMISLDRIIPPTPEQKIGALKLTIAKFYRVTGSSTQEKGVIPDIEFPTEIDRSKYGESSYPSALPWDTIESAHFQKFADLSPIIPVLKEKHEKRIEKNREFQYILEDIKEYKKHQNKKAFSLNEAKRKAEKEKAEAKKKKRDKERGVESDSTKSGEKDVKKDLKTDDPYLEEAGQIMVDFIGIRK